MDSVWIVYEYGSSEISYFIFTFPPYDLLLIPDYYHSVRFHKVIQFVQTHSNSCVMKEKQTPVGLRLLLTFDNVKSTRIALELMQKLGGGVILYNRKQNAS